MEIKKGTIFHGTVQGIGDVEFEVTDILADGKVELTGPGGLKHEVSIAALTGRRDYSIGMTTVIGLQPDPPAAIARVASNTSATVLPSPMAPPQDKSGIVPGDVVLPPK